MKNIILTTVCSLSLVTPLLAGDTNALGDDKSRVSYAIGMMLGQRWKADDVTNLDFESLVQGVKDAQAGGTTRMTTEEMRKTLTQFSQQLAAQQEKKRQELAEKNSRAGEAFLARNKEQKRVVTLPDGLQYKIIADGSGPSPAADDNVSVSYVGTFIDGKKFDSSDKAQFRVGSVIPGWSEALTHMKVGSQWQLFIPPQLAYGPGGRPGIEPNSTLIFTVELLSIEHPQPVTSDIIKVPSAEEMKKGAKVEIIKPEDVQKAQQQSQTTH
ncbi:MAG TPA: FKBP-type peptidyl-prolyl cis-trans isomerase [Candidatus Sulfopaludibacter sp.]|nr:FKBP-type peptidyl-prolyl cis-trans isomerase [Candidatus Sulfopaludibacter sp.]